MTHKEFADSLELNLKEFPQHISISQIRSFQMCPTSWFLKYGTNAKGKYPSRMLIGSLVHKGIETANNLVYHGHNIDAITAQVAMDSVEKGIENTIEYGEDSYVFSENPIEVYKTVRKVAKVAIFAANDIPRPVLVEHDISGFELGPYRLDGYIDAVDCEGRVWDYKVGSKHKTDAEANKDIQLSIYAWAMGTRDVGFVSISSATGVYKIIPGSRTQEQLDSVYKALEMTSCRIYDSICRDTMTDFAPNMESMYGCSGCSFVEICPFGKLV